MRNGFINVPTQEDLESLSPEPNAMSNNMMAFAVADLMRDENRGWAWATPEEVSDRSVEEQLLTFGETIFVPLFNSQAKH